MFKRSLVVAATLAATLFMTSGASAQGVDMVPFKGELPAALKATKAQGTLEVYRSFPAAGGLTGWLVKDVSPNGSGKNLIVYTTKDGEVLLAGMAMDKTGKNLTSVYADRYVPAPDYTAVLKDFNTKANSVVAGNPNAKASITVLFDANCGYCKAMHKLLAPAIDAGELRVNYIPVAILGQDSDIKAAGILAASNPAQALHSSVEGYAEKSSDKAVLDKVLANTQLMKKHGFNGTPGVLYKGKKDGQDTVFIANGVPSNIVEMFERLGISGQVEQLRRDPALARFLR